MTQLTYADAPLLGDEGGQIQGLLDRWMPLEELPFGCVNPHMIDGVDGPFSEGVAGNPARVAWPKQPKPRINHLYWPTGASRWAIGYFLVDDDSLATINTATKLDSVTDPLTAATLKFSNDPDTQTEFETDLFPLTPFPITADPGSTKKLWVLPLVDDRYRWQFQSFRNGSGNPLPDDSATISQFLTAWSTATGVSVTNTISGMVTDRGPDAHEFNRPGLNSGVALDAFAHSFGLRVKRLFDGTVEVATGGGTEETLLDTNVNAEGPVIVGQRLETNGPRPSDAKGHGKTFVSESRQQHPTEITVTSLGGSVIKFFSSTETAVRTSQEAGSSGDADGKAIANSHYYSICYPGFRDWTPTIYDDYILFCFGGEYEEGHEVWTRVQSLPANLLYLDSWIWETAAANSRLRSKPRFVYVPSAHATPTAADSGTTGHDCTYVTGHPSDDCTGASHDATVTIYPIVNGQYSLTAGSVIGVVPTIDGHWLAVTGRLNP